MTRVFPAFVLLSFATISAGQESISYQTPDQTIVDIADAAPTPGMVVGPAKQSILLLHRPSLSSIREVAGPELRLAGLRIDPRTSALTRRDVATSLTLVATSDASARTVTGLPAEAAIDHATFSPDGSQVAFTNTTEGALELWVLDVATASARRVHPRLNGVVRDAPFAWRSDSGELVARTVSARQGEEPTAPSVPSGPVIQETFGEISPARTYQDLLTSAHDADLFEHYATTQIVAIDASGAARSIGEPALVSRVEPSPDGALLLVERLDRPFSFLVPYDRFPTTVEVWDTQGIVVRQVARLPLAEDVPVGRNAVRTGRREVGWRADADRTLYWVEATDGGDPRVEARYRDEVYLWAAPFEEEPTLLVSLGSRFSDVYWSSDETALVEEWWWSDRSRRVWRVKPALSDSPPTKVFDYSYEDRYNAPGAPLTEHTTRGARVLSTDAEGRIFLTGEGASPEGNRPFVDRLDLESGETVRVFHSESPYFETPLTWIDYESGKLLTRRESVDEPPNYYLRDTEAKNATALTNFVHPYPSLRGAGRELIRYDRADGVQLTATLYTPPGYDSGDGPLPMLVWAYPREYKSAAAAAQVRDSPHRFARVSWGSPLYWLTRGFAVLEGATMPIVGEGDAEPNDTYIEQLVASARAAVDEAVRRGVADPERVAIGGHSYGAFMTANLLAHSDLFRAGIARSGAYNRTLTPFGFQSEQRTFWEAPEIYFAMSPFMHADKIDEPILMTHGIADNNSGTFPLQSRRLYHALKGHGATARLVMLPYESHGYHARESVLHTLWEMDRWLDRYVKNAEPRSTSDGNELP